MRPDVSPATSDSSKHNVSSTCEPEILQRAEHQYEIPPGPLDRQPTIWGHRRILPQRCIVSVSHPASLSSDNSTCNSVLRPIIAYRAPIVPSTPSHARSVKPVLPVRIKGPVRSCVILTPQLFSPCHAVVGPERCMLGWALQTSVRRMIAPHGVSAHGPASRGISSRPSRRTVCTDLPLPFPLSPSSDY